MSILGRGAWSTISYHEHFIGIVEKVWPDCRECLTAWHRAHEDRITDILVRRVREREEVVDAPYRVEPQYPILNDLDDGKADIVLIFDFTQEHYIAYEAKKLNVSRTRALSSNYVRDGVKDRFVSGKYSVAMPIAGMLGYVIDGNLQRAERNLSRMLYRASNSILINPPLTPIWLCRKAITYHERVPIPITLHHLLLSAT